MSDQTSAWRRLTERIWWTRYRLSKWRWEWRDELSRKVAWRLPKRVIVWAIYRAGADATTGQWSHVHPDNVTMWGLIEAIDNNSTGADR